MVRQANRWNHPRRWAQLQLHAVASCVRDVVVARSAASAIYGVPVAEQTDEQSGPEVGGEVHEESRWPAAAAIAAIIAVHLVLPQDLIPGQRLVAPIIEAALLVVLMIATPKKLTEGAKDLRVVSIALIALLNGATIFSVGALIKLLVSGGSVDGLNLIRSGFALWITLILGFGLAFWEMDRGGPLARSSGAENLPDFVFPQMTQAGLGEPTWRPRFLDYLYVALTNGTAFSPTDALPLTRTAKVVMAVHSLSSFVTIVIVSARAVNILK